MGTPASQSRWNISSSSQGNKRLRRVKSSTVTPNASRDPQMAQGEDFMIGTTYKPGEVKGSFTVYVEQGDPEVDYAALFATGEYFTLTRAIVGGKSFQYVNAQVASAPNVSGDSEGGHTFTVEWLAPQEQPL